MWCSALILLVATTDRVAAQEPTRRLRVNNSSARRSGLVRVDDIKTSKPQEQHRRDLRRRLRDQADMDLEDEILWRTFTMGRQGGGSFGAPTADANTAPPATPRPTPLPTRVASTKSPTQNPTPMPTIRLATPAPTRTLVTPPAPTDPPTTSAPTDAPVSPAPTDAPETPAPTDAPVTSAPTENQAVPLYCGCFDCTEEVWDTVVGGFTCGERIVFLIGMGSTEEAACLVVAGTEFSGACGACNPATCDDDNRDGGPADPSPTIVPTVSPVMDASIITMPTTPPTEALFIASTRTVGPTLETYCDCAECTEEVWNTVSGLFTCGQLIESVVERSRKDACNLIGEPDSEFADECSPCACDFDPTSITASPTSAQSMEATELQVNDTGTPTEVPSKVVTEVPASAPTTKPTLVPTPIPTAIPTEAPLTTAPTIRATQIVTRCGCATCGAEALNEMAGDFTCSERIDFLMSFGSQELDACRIVAGLEFAESCGRCDPNSCQDIPVADTSAPSASARVTSAPSVSESTTLVTNPKCGCNDCEAAYNLFAGDSSCGERIEFLMTEGATEEDACRRVANVEYPFLCGPSCDPSRCDGKNPPLEPSTPLYCFPTFEERQRYENVWGDYTLEVKEDDILGVCGPSFNKFTRNTVSVDNDELTLQYKKKGDFWEASEVRIVMPEGKMPFQYGTYSWNVKSIQVKNINTGAVRQDYLPPSLVLGMFTWDATEDYTVRENYNHEVDVELGRMADPTADTDGQFLVQPAEEPNLHRFSTKDENGDFQQAPQEYSFTWNPAEIAWDTTAGSGVDHFYSSEQAATLGLEDYVQCLPTNLEVRINLWNLNGTLVTPMRMSDDEMVEVIIENFSYTPTNRTGVEDGGFCTKDCQCLEGSECSLANNQCIPGISGRRKY